MGAGESELLSQEEIDALLARLEAEAAAAVAPPAVDEGAAGELLAGLLTAVRTALPGHGQPYPARPQLGRATGAELAAELGAAARWLQLSGALSAPLLVALRPAGGEAPGAEAVDALVRAVVAELGRLAGGAVDAAPAAGPVQGALAVARLAASSWPEVVVALPQEVAAALGEAAAALAAVQGGGPAAGAAAAAAAGAPGGGARPGPQPLPELAPEAPATAPGRLDLLLDVPLEVTVELGRARRQLRELMSLAPGSLIELDRLAGEAVDVLVNGKLIARGEVVVIDEYFGIRITEIVSPAERLQRLR